jgi:IS5 family transposase
MVQHDLDKKLLERTVRLAKETGKFGWQRVKYVLDSSPLLGAGRVEDTWNLIGRALSTVVDCAARCLEVPREEILQGAGLTLLRGPSLKAALDIDWDDEAQKHAALQRLLGEVESLQAWVGRHAAEESRKPPLRAALEALQRVLAQDLEPDPGGGGLVIRQGVARDRMPSLGDKEMRHGRKSKSKLFNGYKRHLVTAESLILGAVVLPANQPEHEAASPLLDEAEKYGAADEALLDRGYLASPRVEQLRRKGTLVLCKPWPSRNRGRFTKEDFVIDLQAGQLTCPAGAKATISDSLHARFEARTCAACQLRASCTGAQAGRGRTVTIHPQEELLLELRTLRKSSEGRARLRQRVVVEHHLARLGAIQGPRARYKGARRNTLDVRRCAAVANLQAIALATAPERRAA